MINVKHKAFKELVLQDVLYELSEETGLDQVKLMTEFECFDAWLEAQGVYGMAQIILDAHAAIHAAASE